MRVRFSGKPVLVTGATGFIGSHLVERLVLLGADVTVAASTLGWRPIIPSLVRDGRVHFVKLGAFWNSASVKRVRSEFNGVEYVVHLGYAMPRGKSSLETAAEDARRNVLGTLTFAQQLPASVSSVCFASSAMVYGSHPSLPVSETDAVHPVTAYAIGKLATERYLRLWAQESGRTLSILRYATVYGPMETVPRAIPNFIRRILAGRSPVIYGEGDDTRDYVHVLDVVDATLVALARDNRATEIYNVGTGKGRTTREIAEQIIQLVGRPIVPRYEPANGESFKMICDIAKARGELGYEPRIGLHEGLVDEIRYYTDHPQLWRDL